MTLRPIHHAHPARLGALAAAVALVLAVFAGSASAGAGDYPSPLYLSGGASSQIGTSFQLVATAPPSTPATPTAAASGVGVLVGSYTYLYTVDTGSGSVQASATSNSPTAAIQAITVSGLPTTGATVDVYRQKSATGVFSRVAHLVANASATPPRRPRRPFRRPTTVSRRRSAPSVGPRPAAMSTSRPGSHRQRRSSPRRRRSPRLPPRRRTTRAGSSTAAAASRSRPARGRSRRGRRAARA